MGTPCIRAKCDTEIEHRDSVLLAAAGTERSRGKHDAGDPNRVQRDATRVTVRVDIG
jgi:hypothetical protein